MPDDRRGGRGGGVAACVVSAALLFRRLSDPGLWCDEIYTARWTRLSLGGLVASLRTDLHPPLYFVIERAVVRALGESEFTLRALSAACGVAAVAAAAWAFRPSLGRRDATRVAWALALMPAFVQYARMARYYAAVALIALVAHGVLSRALAARGWRPWFAYALAAAAALYTSYVSVALLIGHAAWVWASGSGDARRKWAVAVLVAFALFAPWLWIVAAQVRTAAALPPAAISGLAGAAAMLGYAWYAFGAGEWLPPWTWLGVVTFAASTWLVLLGVGEARRRGLGRALLVPAAVTFVSAWVLVAGFAHATPFVSLPARALFVAPFAAVLLSLGLFGRAPAWARAVAGFLLCVGWGVALDPLNRRPEIATNPIYLTPGREVARAIASDARPADLVLAEDDTGVNYYLERDRYAGPVVDPVDSLALAHALGAAPSRIAWARLGRDGSARLRPAGPIRRALAAGWTEVDSSGYLALDRRYVALKGRLLGTTPESFRVTVVRWRLKSGSSPGAGAPISKEPEPSGLSVGSNR